MSAHAPLLEGRQLRKAYHSGVFRRRSVVALDGVSFAVHEGDVFGIVGESGSGKTTLARVILRVVDPDSGRLRFAGQDVKSLRRYGEIRAYRRRVQAIIQGCEDALNPRMRIRESLREALLAEGRQAYRAADEHRLREMIGDVGLYPEHLDRYPAQLSGGQVQRVMIARVTALRPELIVADEPTSSLDVSVQAQIVHLLIKLQRERSFTLVVISHDIELVLAMANRIMVMHRGTVAESGSADQIGTASRHEYTRRLMQAAGRGRV